MTDGKPDYDPVSVSTLEFWRRDPAGRDETMRILRNERPISWQKPAEGSMMPQADGAGYWAVTSHAGVVEVVGSQTRKIPSGLSAAARAGSIVAWSWIE